jgi:hypothetical protein
MCIWAPAVEYAAPILEDRDGFHDQVRASIILGREERRAAKSG